MKKYVKAFQTINNGTGGTFGLKKIKNFSDMAHSMGVLEGCKKITIVNYTSDSISVVKNNNGGLNLRKKNTNSFISNKQLGYYTWSKKKHLYLYKKKKIFIANSDNMHGARVFGKNK